MTAIVTGVVAQIFIHLSARDTDLMKIVWVVTNSAFIALVPLMPVFMITVVMVTVMIVVMITVVMVIVMTRG